jgi:monovalent cation/hydrogen antiporter
VGTVQGLLVEKGGEVPGTQILVTILLPFAAYLAAEHLHVSGILAAVAQRVQELSGFSPRSVCAAAS